MKSTIMAIAANQVTTVEGDVNGLVVMKIHSSHVAIPMTVVFVIRRLA
jgi:hypothetical protein